MRLITLTLLSATALAAPTTSTYASTLHELSIQTIQSDTCALPQPSNNCAGFNMSDVIIQYGKANKEQQDLVMSAAKSSGATIIHDYKDFGFSGMVPEPVLQLIKVHGESFNLKVFESACVEIPWCGEAPC